MVLYLSTHEFILEKKLPQFEFYIAENKKTEANKVFKSTHIPKNVAEYRYSKYGVCSFLSSTHRFHVVYLDFCCKFKKAYAIMNILSTKIRKYSIVFAFTISMMHINKKDYRKYIKGVEKKIFNITPYHNMVYYKIYNDKGHMPMATLIFTTLNSRSERSHNLWESDLKTMRKSHKSYFAYSR